MATITFEGICTHFSNQTTPMLGDIQHRVVLINASTPTTVAGVNIPPHFATISIDKGEPIPLRGLHLSFSPTDVLTVDDPLMPSLAAEMSTIEPLPAPDWNLLFGEPWPAVAAYVDINQGTLTSIVTSKQSIGAQVVFDSPSLLFMHAKVFPGSPDPNPFGDSIQLSPETQIAISNEALVETNGRAHFFLHYTLGTRVPSAPQVPTDTQMLESTDLAGAGCSDSNYP